MSLGEEARALGDSEWLSNRNCGDSPRSQVFLSKIGRIASDPCKHTPADGSETNLLPHTQYTPTRKLRYLLSKLDIKRHSAYWQIAGFESYVLHTHFRCLYTCSCLYITTTTYWFYLFSTSRMCIAPYAIMINAPQKIASPMTSLHNARLSKPNALSMLAPGTSISSP